MSYEEIDKSMYGTDVFTNGVNSRYAKPKLAATTDTGDTSVKNGEKKKRSTKVTSSTVDESVENGHTDDAVKTKKKTRKTHENGATQNDEETAQAAPADDGEASVKPKKKRAPKVESNNENIDPVPAEEEQPVKKKKSKTPKTTPIDGDGQIPDSLSINELDPSAEATPKVKKPKKSKTPKTTTDTFDDANEYSTNQGIYLFIYI
jgi:hypothetical protein